jgi:hypothetical protein
MKNILFIINYLVFKFFYFSQSKHLRYFNGSNKNIGFALKILTLIAFYADLIYVINMTTNYFCWAPILIFLIYIISIVGFEIYVDKTEILLTASMIGFIVIPINITMFYLLDPFPINYNGTIITIIKSVLLIWGIGVLYFGAKLKHLGMSIAGIIYCLGGYYSIITTSLWPIFAAFSLNYIVRKIYGEPQV